jgi:hypothetical protein
MFKVAMYLYTIAILLYVIQINIEYSESVCNRWFIYYERTQTDGKLLDHQYGNTTHP